MRLQITCAYSKKTRTCGSQSVECLWVGPDQDGAGERPIVVVVLDKSYDDGRTGSGVLGGGDSIEYISARNFMTDT